MSMLRPLLLLGLCVLLSLQGAWGRGWCPVAGDAASHQGMMVDEAAMPVHCHAAPDGAAGEDGSDTALAVSLHAACCSVGLFCAPVQWPTEQGPTTHGLPLLRPEFVSAPVRRLERPPTRFPLV